MHGSSDMPYNFVKHQVSRQVHGTSAWPVYASTAMTHVKLDAWVEERGRQMTGN